MTLRVGHNGGPSLVDDERDERPGNWFAVSREIFDHPIVGIHDRPFTDMEAWLYLLSIAAYSPQEVSNKGSMIVLDPGQIMAAYAYLSTRWKWSPDKVRWYLKRLENEAMITRFAAQNGGRANTKQSTNQHTNQHTNQSTKRNTNQIQIITICNYSIYQYVQQQLHQAKHQATHQAEHQAQHQASHQESNTINTNIISDSESESLPLCAPSAKAEVPTEDPVCVEYDAGFNVLVNGKSIRHAEGAFRIDLPAVEIAARASKWERGDIDARCLTRAREWGKRIAEGQSPDLVIPTDVVGSISAEIVQEAEAQREAARAAKTAQRGTRLPLDWRLPMAWGEWAFNRFDVSKDRIRREGETFRDYWHGATRNATKRDWFAAWRVWCSSDKLGWRERSGYRSANELALGDESEVASGTAAYHAQWEEARAMMGGDPNGDD